MCAKKHNVPASREESQHRVSLWGLGGRMLFGSEAGTFSEPYYICVKSAEDLEAERQLDRGLCFVRKSEGVIEHPCHA